MRRSHSYSDNHKVVEDSPHTYSEGGSCYANGGDVDTATGPRPEAYDELKTQDQAMAPIPEQPTAAEAAARKQRVRKQFLQGDTNAY